MTETKRLVEFLGRSENYPWNMGKIQLVQTHISFVFIGENLVFKVKKPVKFSFLDFSTIKKIKAATEEEFRVNQRLTEGIYLGVIPIYGDEVAGYSFSKKQKIATYGLKMQRFPESVQLSAQLKDGVFSGKSLPIIAKTLGDFYKVQAKIPLKHFSPEKLIFNNLNQAEAVVRGTQKLRKLILIKQAQGHHLKKLAPLIKSRIKEGKIVDGHGDLHAEHILIFPSKKVMVFDAIEFEKAFREADWAYDLSFLVMDLWARGFPILAQKFLTLSQAELNDDQMESLMPAFCAHRATIRAKANALKASEPEVPLPARKEANQLSEQYLSNALVLAYLGLKPTWIIFMGPIAGGKSTLAAEIAKLMSLPHLNSDVIRKSLFGLQPEDDGNPHSQKLYSPKASERTYSELHRQAVSLSDLGKSAVLDGTYSSIEKREALRLVAREKGVQLVLFEVSAKPSTLAKRLQKREGRASVSDARLGLLDKFLQTYQSPGPNEKAILLHSLTKKTAVQRVFDHLLALTSPP